LSVVRKKFLPYLIHFPHFPHLPYLIHFPHLLFPLA
jgi:hypothetical protein